eukprot:6181966-Pleurochrysis_carterae.AAC.1
MQIYFFVVILSPFVALCRAQRALVTLVKAIAGCKKHEPFRSQKIKQKPQLSCIEVMFANENIGESTKR